MNSQILFVSFIIFASHFILVCSSPAHVRNTTSHLTSKRNELNDIQKLSPKLMFEIKIHGILLWVSMGFLMPIGILTIRMSHREECRKRLKILFFIHSISQSIAVIVATAGAVMSIKNFNNAFDNHHQRIGVALYGIIWFQAILGFLRPQRGSKARSGWFFVHWILGTAISLLGVINMYTGFQAYHHKTSKNISIWSIIFTVELGLIIFLYLLQDKLVYMQKQGVILGSEPSESAVTPTQQFMISPHHRPKQSAIGSC
ncbi:cytochrome b561 domain-containing protein At2g30890 [Mercurialis annua]|uniref:cytochrome b561 domain-containing protein At2g30890 n=1 Tax=Mercurialis annua TaxID=3986 RepID=UPI0021605389|nr:cytochrome b561 domain-containing protein At2g30890 [Mercurialis annua]